MAEKLAETPGRQIGWMNALQKLTQATVAGLSLGVGMQTRDVMAQPPALTAKEGLSVPAAPVPQAKPSVNKGPRQSMETLPPPLVVMNNSHLEQCIASLGDEDFHKREESFNALRTAQLTYSQLRSIRFASSHKDAEIAVRAKEIVAVHELGMRERMTEYYLQLLPVEPFDLKYLPNNFIASNTFRSAWIMPREKIIATYGTSVEFNRAWMREAVESQFWDKKFFQKMNNVIGDIRHNDWLLEGRRDLIEGRIFETNTTQQPKKSLQTELPSMP